MVMLDGVADRGGRGPHSRGVTLGKTDVDESWPLIRYLLDDPVHYGLYLDYLEETISGVFDPDRVTQTYQTWAALIEPYAAAEAGEEEFASAVEQLVEYAYQRADDVQEFLSSSQGRSAP